MSKSSAMRRSAVRVAYLLFLFFAAGVGAVWAQPAVTLVPTISTLTGVNGVSGDAADNVPAAGANIDNPSGIATDAAGNVYFADWSNDVVRKINVTTGIMTVYAGQPGVQGFAGNGGPATAATLSGPMGIAFDNAGNLYIADTHNSQVRVVSASGIISLFAGTGGLGSTGNGGLATLAELRDPQAVAPDNLGNVYIADTQNSVIRKVVLSTGIITVVAGTGVQSYTGDGGPATAATLTDPYGIAVDAVGNFYFGDSLDGVIRKVTVSTGIITTIAGFGECFSNCATGDGGPATSAKLSFPSGMAFDSNGNLFFADDSSFDTGANNHVIREVNIATGIISTVVGVIGVGGYSGDGGLPTAAHLTNTEAVAIDSFGNMYVTDDGSQTVRAVTLPHFPNTAVGSTSITQNFALLINTAVSISNISIPQSQGTVAQPVVQEYNISSSITGCTVDGVTVNVIGTICIVPVSFSPEYPGPRGIPLVVATSAGTVNIGMNGIGLGPQAAFTPATISTPVPIDSFVEYPDGEVIDSQGNLYISDVGNVILRRDSVTQAITTIAGTAFSGGNSGDGGPATAALLNYPEDLAVDGAGNLYFADTNNNTARVIYGGSGNIATLAGTGSSGYSGNGGAATEAQLHTDSDAAIDSTGNLYIADAFNHAIRKVDATTGIITDYAGTGTCGYTGDGGPATAATLCYPLQVAFDAAGNVYIADNGNNVIREVTASTGIITTIAGNATGTGGYSGDGGLATGAELLSPAGVVLDTAANLYIADSGNNVMREVNASTGFISTIAGSTLNVPSNFGYSGDGGAATTAFLSQPIFPALDSVGNLYFTDFQNNVLREVGGAAPLNFGTVLVNTSSAAQDVVLTNNGNAALTLSALYLPSSPQFNLGGADTTCTAATSLAPAQSCVFGIVFAPTVLGVQSETLTIVDNQGSQNVALNGNGVDHEPTTTALTVSRTTAFSGEAVVLTATISPAPTGSALGTVSFYDGSTLLGSGAPDSSGVFVLSVTTLPTGANVISAVYSGNATYATSTSANVTVTVTAPAVTTTTLVITPGVTENAGTAVTLTATVLNGVTAVHPGTVFFCDAAAARCAGAAILGTAQLNTSGIAIFKFLPGVGAHSIDAVYQAVTGFTTSTSAAQTLTITGNASYLSFTSIGATGVPGNYTLTGTVSGFGPGAPTGTVTFLNTTASTTLGSAALDPTTLSSGFVPAPGSPVLLQSTVQVGVEWEAVGDFNHDGIPDLAVIGASNTSSQVLILLGVGDGSFQPPVGYGVGQFPGCVTVADVNNDGNLDIIIADTNSNRVGVLLGVGDGTFGAETTFTLSSAPNFVTVGDLNGDGNLDIVTANTAANTITVLLGDGTGSFAIQASYAVGNADGVAIGDFNGDGIPDLAVSNGNGYPSSAIGSISLFIGAGDGTFAAPATVAVPANVSPSALVAADLRNIGTLDLLFADNGNFTGTAAAYVMLGNNDGTFGAIATYAIPLSAVSVAVGDINNDGVLDLVVPANDSDGGGTTVSVLIGVGDGTFGASTNYAIGGYAPQDAVLADFNGDGLLDISTGNYGTRSVTTLLQQQTETATLNNASVTGGAAQQADASYPGDSSHAGSVSTTTSLLPLPPVLTLTGSPNPAVSGSSVTLTATIVGSSGTATGTVSFYSGATQLGTSTLVGGSASFPVGTLIVGHYTYTAVYSGDSNYVSATGTTTETVGAATITVLTVSSTTLTAGTPLTLTGTVTPNPSVTPPTAGQVVFNYQVTVNGIVHNGSYGPFALNNLGVGSWKFFPGAGTYTITATFTGSGGDVASTSAPQTVTVAAAAIFASATLLTPTTISANDYTLVGSVSASGQIAPTGLVTFTDSTTSSSLGTASLDPATLTHSMVLAPGSPISGFPELIFVATGDVNGDGIPDLVTALYAGNETGYISVQLGVGDGTFQPLGPQASWYQLAGEPAAIAIADLNGDGKPDLIVAESSGVGILLGNGDGTFANENFTGIGQGYATFVVAGDLNGDGILDLAVAYTGGPVVLLGNGDGTFGPPIQYAAGAGQMGLAVADFNHDGIPDLIESDRNVNTLSLLLGVGDGTFQAATTITVPATYPALLTAADLRHNGTQDVIVPDVEGANIYILLGNNDGTFQPAVAYPASTSAYQVLAGDVNNDGILDLVTANPNFGLNASVGILPGAGDGTFGAEVNYPTGLITISVALGDFNGDGLLDIATADAEGGSSTIYLQQQTETATVTGISLVGAGNHNVLASYAGDASRTASQSATVALTGQTGTTTVLTFAPDPVHAGQTVVFTATVTPAPTGTSLGTVSFYSGSTLIGTSSVNSSGIATYTVTNVPVGSGTVDAVYSGNALFATSTSASITDTVTLSPTTTTLSASTLTPAFGANVTFTVTISPAPSGTPLGTVSFYDGATLLGNAAINSSGVATFSSTTLPSGSQSITAVYSGNAAFATSTSAPINEQVSAAGATATVATLTASNPTPVAGANVTFTVTIAPVPTGTPLGTVNFYNGATLLGSGTVNSAGIATLTTTLPAGTDVITAVYSGNTAFASATSAPITEHVSPAGLTTTTTTVTSSNLTPAFGESVTFTVTITPAPTGAPLGTASVYSGTTLLGSGTVNSAGVVTLVVGNLPAGSDSITAIYSGNATSNGSTSAAIIETVGPAASTAILTAAPASTTFGQSVTLTVTIAPVPTGSTLGSVSFYNGTTLLGTTTVNSSGIAAFTTTSLPVGTDVLTAAYTGNATDAASTSAATSFIVARAVTTAVLAAGPAVQLATMPITLTAQLTSTAAGVETGSFDFLDGTTVIATVPVAANGQAVFITTTLADGVHSITANYSGDNNFLPSTSSGTPTSVTVSDVDLDLGGDNNKTVAPGAAVTYNFPLSPLVTPTFVYAVTLTASGLPPGATYIFTPSTLPAGAGTTPIALTIQTAASTAMHRGNSSLMRFALGFGLLLPLAGIKAFRTRLRAAPRWLVMFFIAVLSLGAMTCISSCGGGFAGPPALPAQTSYTITVAATSGTLVRTSTVQLNIQ